MFFKIGVLKNFPIFTGNTVLESLFNKVAGLKLDSNTGVSREYCQIFKKGFFTEHLWLLMGIIS